MDRWCVNCAPSSINYSD